MTDILIIILTSAAGFLIGRAVERNCLAKERLFFDLRNFCKQMQNNMKFGRLPLTTFFQKFKEEAECDFVKLFQGFLLSGEVKSPCKLSKTQKVYLERFFFGLNGANTDACVAHMVSFFDYFDSELRSLQAENKSRQKLFQKLGLLTGVIVGIMLI